MVDNLHFSLKLNKKYIWLIAAIICLIPFSVQINGMGVTANYFMLFFVIFAFYGYRYSNYGFVYLVVIILSYVIGLVLFSNANAYFINRQFLSLVAGVIPVLLLFIRIRVPFDTIKLAVIISSLIYILPTIKLAYISGIGIGDVGLAKSIFGSAGYGFILGFGLFFSMANQTKSKIFYFISAIIFTGIIFTFSRAAYLSTSLGLIAYLICLASRRKWKFNFNVYKNFLKFIFIIIVISILLGANGFRDVIHAINTILGYAVQAFTDFFSKKIVLGDVESVITGAATSESARLTLWKQVYDFVVNNNILFGSGMAGLYLVVPEYLESGVSVHSQYFDVFLRTGLIGLTIYLFMWMKLLKGFWSKSPAAFGGLLSMFVYGVFVETTKITQGAFIFFILLNLITDKGYWKRYELSEF